MRWLLVAVLVLPMVMAHGEVEHGEADIVGFLPPGQDLHHIQSAEASLGPGESGNYTLSFSGGPFKAGWHWLLRINVDEGAVRIEPFLNGTRLSTHNVGVGQRIITEQLFTDGTMRVQFTNMADSNTTFQFYYDQTCECQYKRVPLRNGPVWFNIYAEEGETVAWEFTVQPTQLGRPSAAPMPDSVELRATHMVVDDDDILLSYITLESTRETLAVSDAPCRNTNTWNGCIELTFVAQETGQQLVWFDISHEGDPSWTYMILPLVELEAPNQTTPMPWALVLVALALAYRRAM